MRRFLLFLAVLLFGAPVLLPAPAHAEDMTVQEICTAIRNNDRSVCSTVYGSSGSGYTSCRSQADSYFASCLRSSNPTARWGQYCTDIRLRTLSECLEPLPCDESDYFPACEENNTCAAVIARCQELQQECQDDATAAAQGCDPGPVPTVVGSAPDTDTTSPEEEALQDELVDQQNGTQNNQTGSVSDTYNQILEHGIIFANICTAPNQRIYSPQGCQNWTPEQAAASPQECKLTVETSACPCRDSGDCTVTDIMQVIVNVMSFILAISGTIVLVMFVYGGVRFLTAAGNKDNIAAGRKAIVAAVVGTLIIFGSYAIITVILTILTGQEYGQDLEDVVDGQDFFETENN